MKWFFNNSENVDKWIKDFKSKLPKEQGNFTVSLIALAILIILYFIFGDMGRVLYIAIGAWLVAKYPFMILIIAGVGIASLIVR